MWAVITKIKKKPLVSQVLFLPSKEYQISIISRVDKIIMDKIII